MCKIILKGTRSAGAGMPIHKYILNVLLVDLLEDFLVHKQFIQRN